MALIDEIYEQPAVLKRWLETQMESVRDIARAVRERDVDYVFLAARGSSDHAGVYAQYLLGSHNRLPVALAAPSLFTMYEEAPRLRGALVIGISQSGQSPDIVNVIAEGRRQGALTVALTNFPDAPLAQTAEMVLDIHAGPERAIAATKTYTAQLLAVAAISVALGGSKAQDIELLLQVPVAVEKALALEPDVEKTARAHSSLGHCVLLGRGYNYATAQEWALKLKEMAYVFTDVYSTADFQHGPIAIIEQGFPVLAVAPSGAVFEGEVELLQQLRDAYGAELVVISDDSSALEIAQYPLLLPGGLPEWLTPIPATVLAQLFCYHLTRCKGYSTEASRTLRKITLTH